MDVTKITYAQMAGIVLDIAQEVKRRNPIFVNFYVRPIEQAVDSLLEISGGEKGNFTSEHGPKETNVKRKRKA